MAYKKDYPLQALRIGPISRRRRDPPLRGIACYAPFLQRQKEDIQRSLSVTAAAKRWKIEEWVYTRTREYTEQSMTSTH